MHQSEWLRSKTQETINAGKDVEKEEYSFIVGRINDGKTTRKINLDIPLNIVIIQPEDPLYYYWAYTQKIPHHTTGTHALFIAALVIYV